MWQVRRAEQKRTAEKALQRGKENFVSQRRLKVVLAVCWQRGPVRFEGMTKGTQHFGVLAYSQVWGQTDSM